MTLNSPTTFTEAQHAGEFIVSEGPGTVSRDTETLQINHDLVDGTVLKFVVVSTVTYLAPLDADDFDTEGVDETVDLAGILIGARDSTVTGTNAAIPGVPYIARMAEVNSSLLTLFTGSTAQELADVLVALKANHVIGR